MGRRWEGGREDWPPDARGRRKTPEPQKAVSWATREWDALGGKPRRIQAEGSKERQGAGLESAWRRWRAVGWAAEGRAEAVGGPSPAATTSWSAEE